MRNRSCLLCLASLAFVLLWPRQGAAQEAPTGAHYAGRASDTGHIGPSDGGGFGASIPLDLPPSRGGLPIPVQVASSGTGFGAAGAGWDVPLSFVHVDTSFAHRRPLALDDSVPKQRDRITVSIPGRQAEMVLLPTGDKWAGRNEPDLVLYKDGGGWKVVDGNGWTFTFFEDQRLADTGLYLLDSIDGPSGSKVVLDYAIASVSLPNAGGTALSIDLVSVSYNPHPLEGCFKHQVSLHYAVPINQGPQSFTVLGNTIRMRDHRLAFVDVTSRASACTSPERLRRYNLTFYPDADTKQERLSSITMSGRQGTPEADVSLPIASYMYGTATSQVVGAPVLSYATSLTQSVYLPSGVGGSGIANTEQITSAMFQSPYSGAPEISASLQSFIDITGDGRPDLIYPQNGKLWVARNIPGPNGTTTLGTPSQLNDSTFTRPFLDARSSSGPRFSSHINNEYIWTQTIDVNGDGRLDVVDAAEKPNYWIVYLNTPDSGPSGVKWVRRAYRIDKLYNLFVARGFALNGGYLPLNHRVTNSEHRVLECFKWDTQFGGYVPSHQDLDTTLCPLIDTDGDVDVDVDDRQPFGWGPQKSYVEWELKDLNGDGYPDVVFNSSPVGIQTAAINLPGAYEGPYLTRPWGFSFNRTGPNPSWGVEAVLNVRGLYISNDVNGTPTYPFSEPELLIQTTRCGVGLWTGPDRVPNVSPPDIQTEECDIEDINGDGLADRVVGGDVMLGTGSGFSATLITLPDVLARQESERVQTCTPAPGVTPQLLTPFFARETRVLRDVTGDGIPDFIRKKNGAGYEVFVGTGAGFGCVVNGTSVTCPQPIDISGAFEVSRVEETCDGSRSRTKSGLYDVDGDGTPEDLVLSPCYAGEPNCTTWKLDVFPLVGGSAPGRPESGRIVQVDNGYGGQTTIGYRSAKRDAITVHQVPFPEIVVDSIETTGTRSQGGSLAKTLHAYGGIEMFYDSIADAFRPTGYLRHVELRATPTPGDGKGLATATIVDGYSLEPFNPQLSSSARFGRYLRVGRTKDVTVLAVAPSSDQWSLLNVAILSDLRRIAGTSHTVDSNDTKFFPDGTGSYPGCLDVMDPYNSDASTTNNAGQYNLCTARGFLYTNATSTWHGPSGPPSSSNVQTRTRVLTVDDDGRTTSILYQNDLFRSDDDLCVDVTYATPTGTDKRVLSAVAARKAWGGLGCGSGEGSPRVYAEESFEYDKLPYPLVSSQGYVTSHTIYRHATDTGQWLSTIREYDVDYNATGNPIRIVRVRDGDYATRTTAITYDAFGLVPVDTSVSGTNVKTLDTHDSRDPITLARSTTQDPNGAIRSRTFDGFGRPLLDSVNSGSITGVLVARTYQGFDGTQLPERRVVVKEFTDPVAADDVATAEGRKSTTFLDELGRPRYSHVELGDDYGNEKLVVGARTYDPLGRVAFEADPYALSENASTAYGTTQYFNIDGSLALSIRGAGQQPFTTTPDASLERFPTRYEYGFMSFTETVKVMGPDTLTAGSSQFGVSRTQDVTAIGRVLSSSSWQGGTRIEYAELGYDGLGQQTKMIRYQDPSTIALPVEWTWKLDSLGQVTWLSEPPSAPQERTYSSWGELKQMTWTPPSPEAAHSIVTTYDAFGRTTRAVEQNGGVDDPDTLLSYGYDVPSVSPLVTPTGVLGRLAVAKGPAGGVSFSYDPLGRVSAKTHTDTTGLYYYERHGIHADGSEAWTELDLPDNNYVPERVDYAYDSAGRFQSMWSTDGQDTQQLYNALTTDPFGRVRSALYGQATDYQAVYATGGRRLPTTFALNGGDATSWKHVIYFNGFDPLDRELARHESSFGGPPGTDQEDDYTSAYDRLGRLQTSQRIRTGTTVGLKSFSYDPIGNIMFQRDHVGNTGAWMSYQTTDRDRLCRVGFGGGLGGSVCNITYDSFGNVIAEPTPTGTNRLRYFNSGALRTIDYAPGGFWPTGPSYSARFRYDAFGGVQELDIFKASTKERSERRFGDFIVKRTQQGPGGTTTYTSRQFPAPGATISRRGHQGPWIYQFSESSGTRVTTDQHGNFVQKLDYAPYGETTSKGAQRGTAEFSNEQWNDGDALAPFGLVHIGARVYDPVIGRFLSRDPLLLPRTAATSNPYAFAFNDPKNFSDSSGLDPEGPHGFCLIGCFNILPVGPPVSGVGGGGGGGGGTSREAQVLVEFVSGWYDYASQWQQAVAYGRAARAAASAASASSDDDAFLTSQDDPAALQVLDGAVSGVVDMADGIVNMAFHPGQTAAAAGDALLHPFRTIGNVAGGLWNTFSSGDLRQMSRAGGQALASWGVGKVFVAAGTVIPPRVTSRINLFKPAWEHVVTKHFGGSGSQFHISQGELRTLLQSRDVVGSPIIRTVFSGKHGTLFVRQIDMGRIIGFDKYAGANTSFLTVMADKAGNLATAFPGVLK